jgi:succinoglycan biosynthesis protein ExoM
MPGKAHISVCMCTYKRPELLRRALDAICEQQTDGLFTFSIVVCDNDRQRSAEHLVSEFAANSTITVEYCVEPQQSIALARNRALQNATGDYIAFIDDDEFPIKCWLLILFNALTKYKVDGVLGPVKPHFNDVPPEWVTKGRFYERPSYPTGFVIDWKKGRTGNLLMRSRILAGCEPWFRPEFRTGEDQEFFRRMIEKGYVFIWCHEAVSHEIIQPMRWKVNFMLRRALLRGAHSLLYPDFGVLQIAQSILAVPTYIAALPFALLLGYHCGIDLLVRLCDHLGRLLALLGFNPVPEPYVTE